MTDYKYEERNNEIDNILENDIVIEEKKRIPSNESFTFNKGYEVWVTAVFVDIRNSTDIIFNNENQQEAFTIIMLSQNLKSKWTKNYYSGDWSSNIQNNSTKKWKKI